MKNKHINSKLPLTLCVAVLTLVPTAGIANNDTRPAPLHIKIGSPKQNVQNKQFSIKVGKVPQKLKDKTLAIDLSGDTQKQSQEAVTKPLIKKRICADNTTAPQNRYKKLADSLVAYLKAKNRPSSLVDDIFQASTATHTDFELLIITAMIESDLGRVTKSQTSSARGIFQYIEPTWISLIKRYGQKLDQYNIDQDLDIIKESSNDIDILELRHNTKIASLIKAYQLKDETKLLSKYKNGQRINTTDYYIMHMLGTYQARIFYKLLNEKSDEKLADSKSKGFKEAVRLNPAFFFDSKNNGLNAKQAYNQFHRKISQQYKKLHNISQKYGNGNMPRSRCNIPNVQTVSAARITKGQNKL